MKIAHLTNNLNGGELSPKLDSRVDFAKYASGCRIMENMIPLIEGGAMRRPGSYYIAAVKRSAEKARLVSFHFSTTQAYVIEIGKEYMRFYKDRGQIVVAYAAWQVSHPYVLGDLVTNGGSYYRCIAAHTSGGSFDPAKWAATAGAADLAYEIPTTYTEAEVYELKVVQSADTMYIVHPNHAPAKLTRTAHTSWTLANIAFTANPFTGAGKYPGAVAFFEQRLCFAGTNDDPQKIWASCTADFENFTQDAGDDSTAFEYSLYSDKVDRIRWLMNADVLLAGTTGGVWKIWSGSASEPIGISNVSAKRQFAIGMKDMDAEMLHDAVLAVQRGGTRVRHVAYDYYTDRYVGTDLTRAAQHIALGKTRALSGINDMDYQTEPMQILWAVRADGQMLAMTYDIQEKIFGWFRVVTGKRSAVPAIDTVETVVEEDDITTITLTRATNPAAGEDIWDEIESVAVLNVDDNEDEVWVQVRRTIDGAAARYIEYFRPHEIFGQMKDAFFVDCGLSWEGIGAQQIEQITVANPPVVTITGHSFTNGMKVRIYGADGMPQVNCGLTRAYTVANTTADTFELSGIDGSGWMPYTEDTGYAIQVAQNVTGLSHLEGKQVAVHTDIGVHPQKTVMSGSIALAWYANKIHVGIPYDSIIEPMLIEPGSPAGTSKGKKKKIVDLSVAFYESYGCKWGKDEDSMKAVPFGAGSAPALKTDEVKYNFPGDFRKQARLIIKQDLPLPMTVLSVAANVEVADG